MFTFQAMLVFKDFIAYVTSLDAIALGLNAGLVALVHSCRFFYIITAGPIA